MYPYTIQIYFIDVDFYMNLETYDIVSKIRIYAGIVLSCVYMDYFS